MSSYLNHRRFPIPSFEQWTSTKGNEKKHSNVLHALLYATCKLYSESGSRLLISFLYCRFRFLDVSSLTIPCLYTICLSMGISNLKFLFSDKRKFCKSCEATWQEFEVNVTEIVTFSNRTRCIISTNCCSTHPHSCLSVN